MFTFLVRLVVRVEFLLPRYIGSVFILRTFAFLISTLYISHRIQSQSHQMIKWAHLGLEFFSQSFHTAKLVTMLKFYDSLLVA